MKNIILISAMCLVLASCGAIDREVAKLTGQASKVCVDGVTYLQFTSGVSVQVDRQGKPVPCDK